MWGTFKIFYETLRFTDYTFNMQHLVFPLRKPHNYIYVLVVQIGRMPGTFAGKAYENKTLKNLL